MMQLTVKPLIRRVWHALAIIPQHAESGRLIESFGTRYELIFDKCIGKSNIAKILESSTLDVSVV